MASLTSFEKDVASRVTEISKLQQQVLNAPYEQNLVKSSSHD